MLDPRFKKLSFDGDNMLKPAMRRDAVKWLTEEYNSKFKGKAHDATAAADPPAANDNSPAASEQGHQKRRKVSAASFFISSYLHPAHRRRRPGCCSARRRDTEGRPSAC